MALTDKEREKKRKEMDTNRDGSISPEERQAYKDRKALEPDVLSKQELAQKYNFALRVIYANEELKRLFERAVNAKNGQWTAEKFQAKLRDTEWYSNGKYWRDAWVSENEGTEWETDFSQASDIISRRATALGANVGEKELQKLTRRYLYEGWYDGTRAMYLDNALAQFIGAGSVGEGDIGTTLRETAWSFGVDGNMNESWYTNAMQRIARGEATLESLTAEIREKAASRYAPFADKIRNGETTRDALGMYISSYADLMEVDEKDVDLNDPTFKKAWGGMDEQGKPKVMSVYDFETELRRDDRWKQTGQGRAATVGLANQFLQSLGFGGRSSG